MTTKHLPSNVAWTLGLETGLGRLATALPKRFVELFDSEGVSVELYAPAGEDLQKPHDRPELYFVARGSGRFFDGSERKSFGPGDALFVPAGVPHRFESFSKDFAVWVIFYGARRKPSAKDRVPAKR